MTKRKVVVTGAFGFIGSNLVDRLVQDENNEIYAIDYVEHTEWDADEETWKKARARVRVTNDDIDRWKEHGVKILNFDLSAFEFYHMGWMMPVFVRSNVFEEKPLRMDDVIGNADIIYHFAAYADVLPSIARPHDWFKNNVIVTENILEAMRNGTCRNIMYAASSSCYGNAQGASKETDAITAGNLLAPYALTKWMGEQLIETYCKHYEFNAVATRFFNVYGKRVKFENEFGIPIGIFLAQHFNGFPITYMGEGKASRDFIDVRDIVTIVERFGNKLLAGERSGYEVVNVGTGTATSIYDIVTIINQHRDTVRLPTRKNEAFITKADTTKLMQLLGEEYRFITVEEGVRHLMEHEREYFLSKPFPTYGVTPHQIAEARSQAS